MSTTMGGPRPPHCRCILQTVLLIFVIGTASADNKYYRMQSLCQDHFLQALYRKIDGAVLTSQNERNLGCIITFQTGSILQRFMLRFDELQLDCNDHLYIFDGAHAVGTAKVDLSCRNTKQGVGAIYTRTNFVTLKYVTDAWGTDSNGFNLVITAFKDPKHACKEFRCLDREFCISTDLVCDGINHCADGSDEALSSKCSRNNMGTILGLSTALFVVTIVCAVLVACSCLVGISICFCRKNGTQPHHTQQHTNLPLPEVTIGANGAGSGGTVVKMPGNWHHPVGLVLGYSVARRLPLYCQAN